MEKEISKQHVQLPNKDGEQITPKDQLIYLVIKRHMNNKTQEAFPSLETISKESGASVPTIRKIIQNLINADYITIKKDGRKNIYCFNPYKYFEVFSYDFLDNKDLSFIQKSYLVSAQQYMIKENGIAKTTFTNKELSQRINMPESTISKINRELEAKNYLRTIDTSLRNPETGCIIKEKIYDLEAYGQAVVFLLRNHEDRITDNENNIEQLKKENESLKKDVELLKRELFKNKEPNNELVL